MSGRGVTKFVTGVTLIVRRGGLPVRGAGFEGKPLQEKGSPGGRGRKRIPARGTYRENNRPGGRAPTGNAARQADERGADARLGGRNPCDARKEAIPPTTRKTPPARKTPVEARPSGRCRCQEVCGRRTQEDRRWSGRWRYHREWTIAARPGGADCKGSKRNP